MSGGVESVGAAEKFGESRRVSSAEEAGDERQEQLQSLA